MKLRDSVRCSWKNVMLIFLAVVFCTAGICHAQTSSGADGRMSIQLPGGRNRRGGYFGRIRPEILAGVENGSPDSIRQAMEMLRKNVSEYTENEKVLTAVSAEIMRIVWPSARVTWDVFELSEDTPYMGAINSARNGIYDSSTGNVDFLTTVLPSLVLVASPSARADYYELSENALRKALAIRPGSVLAEYLFGILCERQQRWSEAQEHFSAAYSSAPGCIEISVAFARMLTRTGDYSGAERILSSLPADGPDAGTVLRQRAFTAFSAGDYSAAEEYVARVLQQSPNDLEFVLFRAKILIRKKDYIHAVSLLDVYSRYDSDSLEYLLLRAEVQLDWSRNYTAAASTVERILRLYPDSTDAMLLAARISSATDSPVGGKYADELAAEVLEKRPGDSQAMEYALSGFMQRGNWQDAYKISSALVRTDPVQPGVIMSHVTVCVNLGLMKEALDFASAMHRKFPDDETATMAYVLALSSAQKRDAAVSELNSMLAAGQPTAVRSYIYYRRSFLQYSDDYALSDLRSSLNEKINVDALFRLYEIYFERKDYYKAQYYLRQVIAMKPNDTSVKKLNEALTLLMK